MTANTCTDDVVTYDVKIGGISIPNPERILSIQVKQGINRIPSAKILLLDGEAKTGTFAASSSDTFVPGAQIVIEGGS